MKKSLLVLLILVLVTSFSLYAGGKTEETPTMETKVSEKEELVNSQAPELKELVDKGELPPLKERLPKPDDIFIEEADEIGVYGGTWDLVWRGIDDKWWAGAIAAEGLFHFGPDGKTIYPNVAKDYKVNEDSTVYTIYLREGLKWSDGVPMTSKDITFYYNEMLVKETFGKSLYQCYYSVDPETGVKSKAEVSAIDDLTVQVKFNDSAPLFIKSMIVDNRWFFAPSHFYEKILPGSVGLVEAERIAKEKGFSDVKGLGKWYGYYYWVWDDRPTLRPWVAASDPNGEVFVMKRNPYYWKTDANGNQLPYIDDIKFKRVNTQDQYVIEAIAGNIDMQRFNMNDFTMLKENESTGKYNLKLYQHTGWASTGIQLNQAVKDEKYREVFTDIRFREALSIAVDRRYVSEIVSSGFTEALQLAPPVGFPGYDEEWSKKWIEYNPEKANSLLEDMGMKVDDDGFRTFSDGSKFTLSIDTADTSSSGARFLELLKKYYEEAGIRTDIKVMDFSLWNEKKYGNDLMAAAGTTTEETMRSLDILLRPDSLIPIRPIMIWSSAFGDYVSTGGERGVKPEGEIADIVELWDKIKGSKTEDEARVYADQILEIHKNNIFMIGYTSQAPEIFLVKKTLRNLPDVAIMCDEFRAWTTLRLSKVFFENGEK
jgi:peptide/nickel transport system substrate-binding protein